MLKILSVVTFALAVSFASVSCPAFADTPGAHPAYLHALTDLRGARWHLNKRGGSDAMKNADKAAVDEIDACINDIKKASIDDGKDLNDHPKEDAGADKSGDVHRARQLLEKAKSDISGNESNQFGNNLKDRAIKHLDAAMRHIDESIKIGK